MDKETRERLECIERQQMALYRAISNVLTWRGEKETGNRAEYELNKLEKSFTDGPSVLGPEIQHLQGKLLTSTPNVLVQTDVPFEFENTERKTCDCCDGEGVVSIENPMPGEEKCLACDGKGWYEDDIDD